MRRLLTGFEKYSVKGLVVRATTIKDGLTAATWCSEPWPSPFPQKTLVISKISDFLLKASAAADGGSDRIAARDAARVVMEGFLTSAAPYLQALAAGDEAGLSTALRRNVWVKEAAPEGAPEALAREAMRADGILAGQPVAALREGKVHFA